MTHLEFTCSDEKATFLLKASRLFDEGADLEPVKRGRWAKKKRWGMGKWHKWLECSKCGHQDHNLDMYEDVPFVGLSNYCPNCGAKMDGGADHGNP